MAVVAKREERIASSDCLPELLEIHDWWILLYAELTEHGTLKLEMDLKSVLTNEN